MDQVNKKFIQVIEGRHDKLESAGNAMDRAIAHIQNSHELHQVVHTRIKRRSRGYKRQYYWHITVLISDR